MKLKDSILTFLNNFSLLFLVSLALIYALFFMLGAFEFYMTGHYNPRMEIIYSEFPVTLSIFTGAICGVGGVYDEKQKRIRNNEKD